MPFEARQRIAPEVSILLQPLVDFDQRPGIQIVDPFSTVPALGDEVSIFEHAQMSGDCRPADAERRGDSSGRRFTVRKKPQDLAACWIGGGAEDMFQ